MRQLIALCVIAAWMSVVPAVRADDNSSPEAQLAIKMVKARAEQDAASLEQSLDANALFERASHGVSTSADFRRGFQQGFLGAIKQLPMQMAQAASDWRFLRVHQVNGEKRLLIRTSLKTGGFNYIDWITARDAQGQIHLVDFYSATSGELLSETLRRTYVQAATANDPGLVAKLTGKAKVLADNMKLLIKLFTDATAKNDALVVSDFNGLPPEMQKEKAYMILRIGALQRLNANGELDRALTEYRQDFPNDPSVDFICLDQMVDQKEFGGALSAVRHLETFTGGDGFLNMVRGNILVKEGGKDEEAAAEYQKAIDTEPTLTNAYFQYIALTLKKQDFDVTARLLIQMHRTLHIQMKDLRSVPAYGGFVKSPAYQKWLDELKSNNNMGQN